MKFLGIDTTKKQSYLWLGGDDIEVSKILPPYEKHSETLLINIDKFLEENALKLSDIDVFVNVSGPGSFTGIRIGLSTIKAFAYALNKKIVNLSVFDLLKDAIKDGVIILECTSNSVYYAEIYKSKVVHYGVIDKIDIEKTFAEKKVFALNSEHIIDDVSYKINVIDNYDAVAYRAMKNAVLNREYIDNPEPFYIQLSQAERMLKDKEDNNANS